MKQTILILFLTLLTGLCGQANKRVISDFLTNSTPFLPALFYSNNYPGKIDFFNKTIHSGSFDQLKSSSESYKLDSIVTQLWSDELLSFTDTLKYTCEFENEGKKAIIRIHSWDKLEQIWRIADEIYYDFNDDGKLIQVEFQNYVSPIYRYYTRILYVYSNGLLEEEIILEKIDEVEVWDKVDRTFFSYDTTQHLKGVYKSDWDYFEGVWVLYNKTEYTNDANGNIINEVESDYDAITEVWTKKNEVRHVYDTLNNPLETVLYIPGWEAGEYVPDRQFKFSYYTDSEIEKEIYSVWDFDLDGWMKKNKKEFYDRNAGDKIYETLSSAWNAGTSKWENANKSDFYSFQKLSDEVIPNWDFYKMYLPVYYLNGLVSETKENWSWIENNWINTSISTSYFSPIIHVSTNEISKSNVHVYPNPAVDNVNIEIGNTFETDCFIRDITGRVVLQFTMWQRKKVDVSSLKTGIYFIDLQQNGQRIYTGKIVKGR